MKSGKWKRVSKRIAALMIVWAVFASLLASCNSDHSDVPGSEEQQTENRQTSVLSGVVNLDAASPLNYAAKELNVLENRYVLDMEKCEEGIWILLSREDKCEILTLDAEFNTVSSEAVDGTTFRFTRHEGVLYTVRRGENETALFRGEEKLSDLGNDAMIFCDMCDTRFGVYTAAGNELYLEGERIKLPEAGIGYRTVIRGFLDLGGIQYLLAEEIPDTEGGQAGRKLLFPLTGKEIGEAAEVKNFGGSYGCAGDGEYVYYIDGMYLSRTDGEKIATCGGLLSLGLSPQAETVLLALGGGRLLAAQKDTLLLLEEEVEDPNLVTLRAMCPNGVIDPNVMQFIKEYNAEDNGVKIEVRQYFGSYVSMNLDYLEGGFDLILGSYGSVDRIRSFAEKGELLPMREALGEDPEELGILSNLVKAGEIEGECYYLPVLFGLKGVALPEKIMGEKRYFENVDEFIRTVDEIDDKRFFRISTREVEIEEDYGHDGYEEWVDWETKTCYFDDPGFAHFLEFLKQYAKDWDEVEASGISDKVLLYPGASLDQLDSTLNLQIFYEKWGADQPYSQYGMKAVLFPVPGRASFHGLAITSGCIAAMFCGGEHQTETAAFLQRLFSEEVQQELAPTLGENYTGIGCFPVVESALNRFIEAEIGYNYSSLNGSVTEIERVVRHSASEERQELIDYLHAADHYAVGSVTEIAKIVKEEAKRFFADEITSEKAAEYIQNRVSLYLAEQG